MEAGLAAAEEAVVVEEVVAVAAVVAAVEAVAGLTIPLSSPILTWTLLPD